MVITDKLPVSPAWANEGERTDGFVAREEAIIARYPGPKGEPKNLGEILDQMGEEKQVSTLIAKHGVELDEVGPPDAQLISNQTVRATLEGAYKASLAAVALIYGEHLKTYNEELYKAKERAAAQLRHTLDVALNFKLNQASLRGLLATFDNIVNNVRVTEQRLTGVEREQETMGDVMLPLGAEVEVIQLTRIGKVIGISQGFKDRPYYTIRLRDKYTGAYGKDPMDIVHCYTRQLSFDRAKFRRIDHAKD